LEVLLASALSVLLMAALYVGLDIQLRLAQEGRDAIELATVTRAIISRINADLAPGIGQVLPAASNTGSAANTTTGTTGSTTEPAVTEVTTTTDTIPFQAGVIGESDRLVIYVSRATLPRNTDESGENPIPADVRRVCYWQGETGLCRQEIPWVTSEQLQNNTNPITEDNKDESSYLMAEEIIRVQFEYWDGSGWQSSWDGRTLGADGKTPMGPPAAIRIRFWMNVPGENINETVEKEFRHTVALLTAAGPATTDADAAATNGGM
jgi:hypothetical protein